MPNADHVHVADVSVDTQSDMPYCQVPKAENVPSPRLWHAAFFAIFVLNACSGSSTATPSTPISKASHSGTAKVALSLDVPAATATKVFAAASSSQRSLRYVSPATLSLSVVVTSASGVASSPLSFPCTATCSATFTAPIGQDTIALTLTDAPSGGHALSLTNATPVTIAPGIVNSISLTANPVVDHVNVAVASPTINAGTASTVPVTVDIRDAANRGIVGPGQLVDAQGNPLTLTLNSGVTPAAYGTNISFTAPIITTPVTGPINATYNGNSFSTASITVVPSTPLAGAIVPASLATVAEPVNDFPVTGGAGPHNMVLGPDGNTWFTEYNVGKIGRITPSGVVTEFPTPNPACQPLGIAAGPNGTIWFSEDSGSNIGRLTIATGVVIEFATSGDTESIVLGPDGNMWFTDVGANMIGQATPSGIVTEHPVLTGASGLFGITVGSDGQLWFTEGSAQNIGSISTSGTVHEYPVPGIAQPRNIATGADGNFWFTDINGNSIGRLTPSGTATYFTPPTTGHTDQITSTPDGKIWFTERSADKIASIDTASPNTIVEYPIAGAQPIGIAIGPNDNLWYSENSSDHIGELAY